MLEWIEDAPLPTKRLVAVINDPLIKEMALAAGVTPRVVEALVQGWQFGFPLVGSFPKS